jgi:hypothetical protein
MPFPLSGRGGVSQAINLAWIFRCTSQAEVRGRMISRFGTAYP